MRVALAAIGLWYDDYTAGDPNPVTQDLLDVLSYTPGVEANDMPFGSEFPYVAMPHSGTGPCSGLAIEYTQPAILDPSDGSVGVNEIAGTAVQLRAYPNPMTDRTAFEFNLKAEGTVRIEVYTVTGKLVSTPFTGKLQSGKQTITWDATGIAAGTYLAKAVDAQGVLLGAMKLTKQ